MADHPSFSLGLGLSSDDDEGGEGGGGGGEQVPDLADAHRFDKVMQRGSYPSFDLVFDEDEVDFRQAVAPDSDLDCGDEEPRPLKRLRRGRTGTSSAVSSAAATATPPMRTAAAATVFEAKEESGVTGGGVGGSGSFCSLIDEIEEFSSQEEPSIHADEYMRSAIKDAYSSCKVSLRNQGVLMIQSTTKTKTKKITPNSISSTLSNLEKSDRTKLLPKLTISPLRKIHILDTDSDSDNYPDSGFDHKKNEAKLGKGHKEETIMNTPALDEFCNEYFRSKPDINAPLNKDEPGTSACSSRVFNPVAFTKDFEDMMPEVGSFSECSNNYPCSKYFNHSDARIKALVRERLPHFIPIGMADGRDNGLSGRETLNYMCQADPKWSAKSRKSKNTQLKGSTPTDVGVELSGKDSTPTAYGQKGHWLTQDGKKIYVSKDGKEMTGRLAYRQYKRESGAKFRRAKKPGTGNRKRGKK